MERFQDPFVGPGRVPTGPIREHLNTRHPSALADGARSKLHVAVTRARHGAAFVVLPGEAADRSRACWERHGTFMYWKRRGGGYEQDALARYCRGRATARVQTRGTCMQKIEVRLEDDLTGGPAVETVQFGVDGANYELDLNEKHAADLRRKLAPFVERARLAQRRHTRGTSRTAASRERSRQIRAWAEQQGFDVADHGRLPANVIKEYERAMGGGQAANQPPSRSSGRRGRKLFRRPAMAVLQPGW